MTIEGKVTDIINRRELIINRGSNDGAVEGMRFKVMDQRLTITDPETQEPLGTLEREKIRVKISEVQPRFSIARTYETYQVAEPSIPGVIGGMFSSRTVTKVRTLENKEDPIQSPLDRIASVKPGDEVVGLEDIA